MLCYVSLDLGRSIVSYSHRHIGSTVRTRVCTLYVRGGSGGKAYFVSLGYKEMVN